MNMAEEGNPFTPSFGEVPLYLAGRDRMLYEMESAFRRPERSPSLTTLVSGARGTGKTALLAKIASKAEESGWVVVKSMAAQGMLEDIYQHAVRDARHLVAGADGGRRITGLGIGQLLSLEWSEVQRESANWRMRIEALLDALEEHGSGLAITVDEVDPDVEELVLLTSVYQLLVMDNRKIALVMAGLPYNIEKAKSNKRISFVRRAQQRRLARISDEDVRVAIRETVEQGGRSTEDAALEVAVGASQGFPFMIQLVGYRMWEESAGGDVISERDALAGSESARAEMRDYVLESTYRELSDGDVDFLKAMLEDDGPSTLKDIGARLGKPSGHVGTYKERLLRAGVIGEPDRNKVGFELPGFREFLIDRLAAS